MMIDCAASKKRWTRWAARIFAVLIERSTARCFQAGSSLGLVTGAPAWCAVGEAQRNCTGR
jgi:hypothetical protein